MCVVWSLTPLTASVAEQKYHQKWPKDTAVVYLKEHCSLSVPWLILRSVIAHIPPYGHNTRPFSSCLLFPSFSEQFFSSVLLICDRLSVHWRDIFKFSLPMPLWGRTSAFLEHRKALMQPRVTSGAVSNAPYPRTCIFTSSPRTTTSTCLQHSSQKKPRALLWF